MTCWLCLYRSTCTRCRRCVYYYICIILVNIQIRLHTCISICISTIRAVYRSVPTVYIDLKQPCSSVWARLRRRLRRSEDAGRVFRWTGPKTLHCWRTPAASGPRSDRCTRWVRLGSWPGFSLCTRCWAWGWRGRRGLQNNGTCTTRMLLYTRRLSRTTADLWEKFRLRFEFWESVEQKRQI